MEPGGWRKQRRQLRAGDQHPVSRCVAVRCQTTVLGLTRSGTEAPASVPAPSLPQTNEANSPPLHLTGGGSLMASILPPGTVAPDFSLNVTPDQQLSLSEL